VFKMRVPGVQRTGNITMVPVTCLEQSTKPSSKHRCVGLHYFATFLKHK